MKDQNIDREEARARLVQEIEPVSIIGFKTYGKEVTGAIMYAQSIGVITQHEAIVMLEQVVKDCQPAGNTPLKEWERLKSAFRSACYKVLGMDKEVNR